MSGGVNYNERVFVAGPTEAGKSELLNHIFSQFQCQRLLYDTKGHEWSIDGVEPVSDPAMIDWREPIIHYVTTTTEVDEAEDVFAQANGRRHLVVCVHELADLCAYHTNNTPPSVNRYLAQGGANGRGFLGASQVPVDMPKRAKSQANHTFTLVPALEPDHLKIVAGMSGYPAHQMAQLLAEADQEHGPYSFIHWPRGARQEPTVWPPMPEWKRAETIVKRREGHAGERAR